MCKWSMRILFLQAGILLFTAGSVFSQVSNTSDEPAQRGSIPDELLRPRRDEAPRYPIDTVIGELGKGRASEEAYRFAQRVATALLDGNENAAVLSAVNKVFLEGWISAIDIVHPRLFRMGSGREEPDGSFSFLVRFVGREEGITGELYVRFRERSVPASAPPPEEEDEEDEEEEETVVISPAGRIWVFEDLILEEPRSRESENKETKHRYDFSPYERFF